MREVLSKIKPSKKEEARLKKVSEKLQAEIEDSVKKVDSRAHAAVLGSASRGTWLRYEKDIDVFLIMPLEYEKKELEEIVTKIGKKVLKKTEKRYAEHPYIKGFYDGFEVEIVPCYAIKTLAEMKSAVDRTPFHDEFVKKNIKAKEDEVRLLKQFLAGIGCYGAEAKVEGFSGYLCELLVIKYGSFKKVLKAASGWKAGKVISIGALPAGIAKKFKSPLVFIDPVDPKRNVASALSEQKFSTFVAAAGAFLKSPRKEFFFPRKRKVVKSELAARLEERGTDIVCIVFRAPDVIDDILYTQLRRALKIIVGVLEREEFSVVGRDFFVENGRIFLLIELDSIELSASRLHTGPPANSEHEKNFLAKYEHYRKKLGEPFIKDGRWYITLERKYRNAEKLLREFLSKRDLEEHGIPGHIASTLSKGFSLLTGDKILRREFLQEIQEYLDPKFPWEA